MLEDKGKIIKNTRREGVYRLSRRRTCVEKHKSIDSTEGSYHE